MIAIDDYNYKNHLLQESSMTRIIHDKNHLSQESFITRNTGCKFWSGWGGAMTKGGRAGGPREKRTP